MNVNKQKIAIQVTIASILVNFLLTIYKLTVGFLAHSNAMISDAIHSLSDVFSSIVVIIGVKLAAKDSDEYHPYGHERFECVAAIILSGMLFLTGLMIGYQGIQNIIQQNYQGITMPGIAALIAAIISIIVKEGMFWYTWLAAKKIQSGALKADAWHHRSDALSSIGSFIGVLGARLGILVLDSVASLVICFFILKAAIDIFKEAIDKMMDTACDEDTTKEISQLISSFTTVKCIDSMKTRKFGDRVYIDVELSMNRELSLEVSHQYVHQVHDAVEKQFPMVKHCMIHVNPYI